MVDEQFVVTTERLQDDLAELKSDLRGKYKAPSKQVMSADLRARATHLAETWMVNIAPREDVQSIISAETLGNLNISFQRLLTFAEHATKRSRYDVEISTILKTFTLDVIIPLKRATVNPGTADVTVGPPATSPVVGSFRPTAFVGHSFSTTDSTVCSVIINSLIALGISVETGIKPKADRISDKVKQLIDQQYIFVGIFTRRDKIARKKEWTTSPWVIDEKAYAVGANKKLILLKELGVESIGGIQGDYEYIEFSRETLHSAVLALIQLLNVSVSGFRK
jgi:hypothetical protein